MILETHEVVAVVAVVAAAIIATLLSQRKG
jgi:hypothetical protein